jgi:hypothetical protein
MKPGMRSTDFARLLRLLLSSDRAAERDANSSHIKFSRQSGRADSEITARNASVTDSDAPALAVGWMF